MKRLNSGQKILIRDWINDNWSMVRREGRTAYFSAWNLRVVLEGMNDFESLDNEAAIYFDDIYSEMFSEKENNHHYKQLNLLKS